MNWNQYEIAQALKRLANSKMSTGHTKAECPVVIQRSKFTGISLNETKWQPIDSAPKDQCIQFHSKTFAMILTVTWDDEFDEWVPVFFGNSSEFQDFIESADAWRPLPPPPL